MGRTDLNPSSAHDYKVKSLINIKFTHPIPGNSSIKHLPDREILARIERTKDPTKREKESPVYISASLIYEVHKGLMEELINRRFTNE